MKFVSKCVFLKLDKGTSKSGKDYCIINLLDDDNNSHKLFAFGEDLQKKLSETELVPLKDILDVAFEATELNGDWSVRILDFKKVDESNGELN